MATGEIIIRSNRVVSFNIPATKDKIYLPDMRTKKRVDPSYVLKAMSYDQYRRSIDELLGTEKSPASKDSGKLLEYTKLNVVRMKRLDKTAEIIPELKEMIDQIDTPQTWLVLTEGWCGDAAQVLPVLNKIARLNSNINLKFLLRDENPGLMDQYLTNGKSRSIPKLLVVDEIFEELFNWGPRPGVLQEMVYHMTANAANNDTIKEEMHRWLCKE